MQSTLSTPTLNPKPYKLYQLFQHKHESLLATNIFENALHLDKWKNFTKQGHLFTKDHVHLECLFGPNFTGQDLIADPCMWRLMCREIEPLVLNLSNLPYRLLHERVALFHHVFS